jgi:hypothetical protein
MNEQRLWEATPEHFIEFQPKIMQYAYAITRNWANAKDIVQEVFISFFNYIKKEANRFYESKENLWNAIKNITYWLSKNYKRDIHKWKNGELEDYKNSFIDIPARCLKTEIINKDYYKSLLKNCPYKIGIKALDLQAQGYSKKEISDNLELNYYKINNEMFVTRKWIKLNCK